MNWSFERIALAGSGALLATLAWTGSAAAYTGRSADVPGHPALREDFAWDGSTKTGITQSIIGRSPSVNADQKNTIFYNRERSNGRLLVFFPGKGNRPEDYRQFLMRAAHVGYHVISLAYWNHDSSERNGCYDNYLVTSTPNVNACIEALQGWEYDDKGGLSGLPLAYRNTGAPALCYTSPAGSGTCTGQMGANGVDADDPARARLRHLLAWLEANFPEQNLNGASWGSFLANEGKSAPFIDWSKVTPAGHSDGAQVAAYVAMTEQTAGHAVRRVLMFSGPNVYVNPVQGTYPTPASAVQSPSYMHPFANLIGVGFYGSAAVNHANGDAKSSSVATHNWTTMGLSGTDTCVDSPGWKNHHRLYTNSSANGSCGNGMHGAVIQDCGCVNGVCPFQEVWDDMLAQ